MDTKTKIALWCVRGLGLLSIALLVIFFSGAFPQWFTGRGDLFRLTSVKKFKEDVDKPYHHDESVHTAPLDSGIVWWLGDSFSRVQFGHKPLPEEVSDKLSAERIGKVAAVDYIDLQGSPKSLFALAAARAKEGKPVPKVIVVECVERNVYANFGANAVFDYGDVAPWNEGKGLGSKVKRIRRRAFLEAPGTVDFKLRRFPPVAALRELTDTWRYTLYKDTHPGADEGWIGVGTYHETNPFLAFAEDTAGVLLGNRSLEEYQAVVEHLKGLDSLAKSFGARLLFVMAPNRNLFWRDDVNEWFLTMGLPTVSPDAKHYFDFYDMLDSAGIQNVDLTVPFFRARRDGQNIFWRTDSHWNGNAHEIASGWIATKLSLMLFPKKRLVAKMPCAF
jgi:hypothetical protein